MLKKIIKKTFGPLYQSEEFYTNLETSSTLTESLLRTFIYGIIASGLAAVKSLFILPTISYPFNQVVTPRVAVTNSFINTFMITFIILLAGAAAMWISSIICKGNSNFLLHLKATASMLILLPLYMLLQLLAVNNTYLGLGIAVIFMIFIIWQYYNASIYASGVIKPRVKIIVILLSIFLFTVTSLSFYTAKTVKTRTKKEFDKFLQDRARESMKGDFDKQFKEQMKRQIFPGGFPEDLKTE